MRKLEINPLAVFGLRELDHCPPHFTQVRFELRTDIKYISNWIWENLQGRFWLGQYCYVLNESSDSVVICYCAAFELGSEASYFSLILDTINTFEL